MPTYEYRCTECGEQLEVVQSFTDDALTECPVCKGSLRKLFGNVGVVFKGSGFYRNDSRSAKKSNTGSTTTGTTSSDSTTSTPKEAATSTKSEAATSTPAAKPTTPSSAS